MKCLDSITNSMYMNLSKLWEIAKDRGACCSSVSPHGCKESDMTLPTKVLLVKAMAFPAVMYGCESWTVKKAEC